MVVVDEEVANPYRADIARRGGQCVDHEDQVRRVLDGAVQAVEGGALWGVTGDHVYALLVEWRLQVRRLTDRIGDDFTATYRVQPEWVDDTEWQARWRGLYHR